MGPATRLVAYLTGAYYSLYSALNGKYNLGEIKEACEQMAQAGVMEIKHAIFATPTPTGEELIAAVTGDGPAPKAGVPPFPARHIEHVE